MNSSQIPKTLKLFQDIGFPNVERRALETLNDHYIAANRRLVMVISHTTTHDFLLGLLLFGQSSIPITMFTNFKSPILKQFAKQLGMLTHQQGMSNTQSIIEHLQHKKQFGLLIALGRTRKNEALHSGYFYIAQKLQCPIIVLGFDYFLKCGIVSAKSWQPSLDEKYENFQNHQEKEMLQTIQSICPLKLDFQVGFSAAKYPYADLQNKEITAPSMVLLYAHLAKEQCMTNPKMLLWIVLIVVIIFLILILLCSK